MKDYEYFFQLLQVAIGHREQLSEIPTAETWSRLFDISRKQALQGIAFYGVQQLPREQWPSSEFVLKWMAVEEYIKKINLKTTAVCLKLTERLEKDGFSSCILKGQANHIYYDHVSANNVLGSLRVPGDVDVWVRPASVVKHPVKTVIEYFERKELVESLCYLHAEVRNIDGVPVEIHFRPSFMNAPWNNCRFLRLFEDERSNCIEPVVVNDESTMHKLRTDYDVIFQLNHIYRHLIDEGVGLRQVLDYYMLLKAYHDEMLLRPLLMNKTMVFEHICRCGMKRFASALMYVLQTVFVMPDSLLLCKPSSKDGAFLLYEIMRSGNFGHFDTRMQDLEVKKGKTSYQVKRAVRRFSRNFRFIASYPSEVICEPIVRIIHFAWRKFKMYRY